MSSSNFFKEDQRIEKAVGELAAAIFALGKKDIKAAFRGASAAANVILGMKHDMIRTGRITYKDL